MAEDKGMRFAQFKAADCAKAKEESVPLTAQAASSCGVKRKSDSPTNDTNKRRFIWPVDLHNRFVAAVFDVGLRTCTPKDVHTILAAESLTPIGHESCKSQLLKLRQFRDPDRLGHQPFYGSASIALTGDKSRSSFSASSVSDLSTVFQQKQLPAQVESQRSMIRALNSQIMQISHTLSLQATFLEHMQSSFARQTMLYNQLMATIGNDAFPSLLDASTNCFGQRGVTPAASSVLEAATPALSALPARQASTLATAPVAAANQAAPSLLHPLSTMSAGPARTELSMINEMREQMTLHRRLLQKKEEAMEPALADPPHNSSQIVSYPGHDTNNTLPLWDEDALFFFLENEFCTTPQHKDAQDAL